MSEPVALAVALLALRSPDEAERFLTDLCTPSEVRAMEERWRVAQFLDRGLPYREVAERAHASTTTVVRVAKYLKEMPHRGYRLVLDRIVLDRDAAP